MKWELDKIEDLTRLAEYLCSVFKDTGQNELADRVIKDAITSINKAM